MEKQGKRYTEIVNKDREGRTFAKSDLVWVHLCKERYAPRVYGGMDDPKFEEKFSSIRGVSYGFERPR
ncbi:hypothetical protein CR513_19041, partial [Mucuna pruriens]